MSSSPRILYCHCAYATVLPEAVKNEVLSELSRSGVPFEAVADLCEMSARCDPSLKRFAEGESVRIAACHPRAVKWLFAAAGAPLSYDAEIASMRVESAGAVCGRLLAPHSIVAGACPPNGEGGLRTGSPLQETLARLQSKTTGWKSWFPVIDYARCTNCMQCLSFCLFGVYGVDERSKIQVQNQDQCKTNCPACSRVCPEAAIIFPKHGATPINGGAVTDADTNRERMKVDISSLFGGDIYSLLRERTQRTGPRFSKERDPDTALRERQRCLAALAADIPPEVLMSLPSQEEIARRSGEARARAQAALEGER